MIETKSHKNDKTNFDYDIDIVLKNFVLERQIDS